MARLAEEEVDKPWGLIPNWKVLICGLTISALGVGAMTRTCSGVAVVVLVLAWMMAPHAQSPDGSPVDPTLRFEVASVKPNKAGDVHWMLAPRGSQAIGNNVPLDAVIRAAYQVSSNDIVGAPAWTSSERFDIVAKAPPGMTLTLGRRPQPGPFEIMLRNLLAERFQLGVHAEAREMPVYGLVRARRDGKLGPRLQPVSEMCAAKVAGFIAGRRRPTMDDLARPGQPLPCGALRMSPDNIESGGATMAQLAEWLSGPRMSGRLVQDRTALTGIYSVSLRWTPSGLVRSDAALPDQPLQVNGVPVDVTDPSLFTALSEQLGLKLTPTRAPLDVLVIDHVEHPMEN
jgi:uncharacterized protein (TIGR03435 family)